MLEFEKFPKIGRYLRDCTITEKLDGTNAQIYFDEEGNVLVGSRKREIFPEGTPDKSKGCDNYGFAGWVYANRDALFAYLGPGRHFGEWAGGKVACGYGTKHKRFYLFNVGVHNIEDIPAELFEAGLDVVPTLYHGEYNTSAVMMTMGHLAAAGSCVNDYPNPEGIMIYHHGMQTYSKVTFEHDGGKGPENQSPEEGQ